MRSKQLSFFGDLPPKPKPRRPGNVLAVLPDAARVEARVATLAAQTGLAAGPLACTFAQLQEAVIGAAGPAQAGSLRPAPRLVRTLLYRRLARERTPAGSVWHAIRAEPGFARALGALGSVLAEGLLSPAALLALCPELPAHVRSRVEPLARVLAAGELELRAAGLCEPGEAVRTACERLRAGGPLPSLLQGAGALHLSAVLDWTPARLELLFALAARLGQEGLKVLLHLPFWPRRPFLSGDPLGPVLSRIEALGAQAGQAARSKQAEALPELVYEQPGSTGPLAPFRERLFAEGGALDDAPEGLALAEVQLVSCAGPAAQAREVARRVADQLDGGCAPDQIAVAVRSLAGGAAEQLGAALEQLGVPWRERRGRPALPTPPVQLALSLYQLAERDLPRAQLSALLGSGLLWLREEGERASAGAIDRILREAAVRDDRGPAEGETGAIAAQLALLADRKRRAAQAEERERRREGLLRELAEVEEVARRAARAVALVRSLPERATLTGHGAALLGLLEQLGLAERLRRGPGAPGERGTGPLERALESARARDLAALEALGRACRELSQAAALLGRAGEEVPRGDFARLLSEALSEASLRPGGARGCAVELVELRELPGRSFTHLHVAGLVDGELPAQPAGDPLLSDEDKRAINRAARRAIFRAPAEGESPVLPQRQAEEPLLFALALAAATRSLTLLWPRADAQGRELLRSPFADEAARAAGLAPGDGDDEPPASGPALVRARLAPVPHLEECRSPQELLARAALEGLSEPAFRLSAPAPAALGRSLLRALLSTPEGALGAGLRRAGRAALAERERVRAFVGQIPPGRFSGQLSGAALALAQPLFAFGPEAPLSATLLEQDATCPFRTLGRTLLGLDDDDPPDEVLSPRDRGSLLHRCLEAFFSALGPVGLRAGPEELALLEQTATEVMDEAGRTQHVGHPGLWKIERSLVLRQLEAVVRAEAAVGSRALHLEQRFGFVPAGPGDWPALQLPAPEGDGAALHVRGAIDRIDQPVAAGLRAVGTGGDTGSPLLVLDYKSGGLDGVAAKASADRWLEPEHQLLLYAAAVQSRYPGRPVDATLLSLRHAERTRSLGERAGKSKVDLAALLALDPARRAQLRVQTPRPPNLADAVWERVRRLRQGTLPAAPLDCDHCHLRPVCRVAALPVLEDKP
jgi:hypothetical protein